MWKILIKDVDFGGTTSFLDHVYSGCTQRECVKLVTILWQTTEICSNPGFLLEPRKNYLPELQGNLMQKQYLIGPMTWKVMQRNVWTDIANLQTKHLNNCTKSRRHAWMTINFKEEENESVGEISTVCSQIILKCLLFASYWWAWYFMVCEQTWSCGHEMEKSL